MIRRPAFTFLELLIALSLFLVAMLSVLHIFPINRRLLTQTAETTQAAFLAQEQMEQLVSAPYDSLTPGTYVARSAITADTTSPFAAYQREVVVTLLDGSRAPSGTDLGLKKISLTIYWSEHGINRMYPLSTYVSRR